MWRKIQLHNLEENHFIFAQLLDYFMKNFTERKEVHWVRHKQVADRHGV